MESLTIPRIPLYFYQLRHKHMYAPLGAIQQIVPLCMDGIPKLFMEVLGQWVDENPKPPPDRSCAKPQLVDEIFEWFHPFLADVKCVGFCQSPVEVGCLYDQSGKGVVFELIFINEEGFRACPFHWFTAASHCRICPLNGSGIGYGYQCWNILKML